MMPKTLYRYPRQRERQDISYNLVTELGFQKDDVYLTFVHHLMKKGKKSTAENLFRKTLNIIEQKTKYGENAFAVLEKAVKNVEPSFFLKKARLGGTSQQIPAALDKKKKKATAIRFLIQIATEKQKKALFEKIVKVLQLLLIVLQLNFMKLLKDSVQPFKREMIYIN